MDKMVLQSSRSTPTSRNNLAVGVYQDGELHLTPVSGVIELRPAFNYFDKQDKRSKDDNKDGIKMIFYINKKRLILLKFIGY